MPLHTDTGPYSELACLLNLYVKLERSYFYEFYEKHFPGLSGSGLIVSKLQCSHKTEFLSLRPFHTMLLPETEKGAL